MASSARGGGRGAEETAPMPLPPPPRLAAAAMSSSSPASIRALLLRTGGGGGGAECQQSPRSLLSRILLRGGDHNGGNGGGGGGGTFGCRVRLPRRYSSTSSTSSGGGARKDDGTAASEQSADDVGSAARIKVVERAPELPVDTPRSSLGRKKPEEELVSMNLGLGASLVLLLSKSAVELNKMVELRSQMEALVSGIRQEAVGKEKQAGASAPACSQESNGSSTTTVISDPIARAAEDALSDNCSGARTADRRAVIVMEQNQMEAELQIELSRLQSQQKRVAQPIHGLEVELPPLQVKTRSHVRGDSPSRSCVDDGVVAEEDEEEEEEEEGDEEEEYDDEDDDHVEGQHGVVVDCNNNTDSPPHGGVSARALERRLHELLQRRQQDRIVQLEAALDGAQRRLQEREREVVWWRDAAQLVSHRRDESRRLRCAAAS